MNTSWAIRIPSHGVGETLEIGRRLGGALAAGAVLALDGDLGSGKTTLAKGIAEGLGADPRAVTSPTFVLVQHYPGRVPVHHVDAYRLDSGLDLLTAGGEDLFGPGSVTLVEWPERIPDLLAVPHLEVRVERTGPESRSLMMLGRNGFSDGDLRRIREALDSIRKGEGPVPRRRSS